MCVSVHLHVSVSALACSPTAHTLMLHICYGEFPRVPHHSATLRSLCGSYNLSYVRKWKSVSLWQGAGWARSRRSVADDLLCPYPPTPGHYLHTI